MNFRKMYSSSFSLREGHKPIDSIQTASKLHKPMNLLGILVKWLGNPPSMIQMFILTHQNPPKCTQKRTMCNAYLPILRYE